MQDVIKNIFTNLISSVLWVILGSIITFLYTSRRVLKMKVKLFYLKYIQKEKLIRFSISYLFRIKLNGEYLLIKGNRIEQLQPIGGVYKYYDSFKKNIQDWDIKDDSGFPIDETSKHDLRIRVPLQYVIKTIDWFKTKKNREYCVFRELYEELLSDEFFKDKNFNNLSIEYLKTNIKPITYSKYFKINEILIADIFELNLTKDQEKILSDFIKVNNSFKVVSEDSIKRGSIDIDKKSYSIGEHTEKLI